MRFNSSIRLANAVLLVTLASCQSHTTPLTATTDGSYLRLSDNSTKALVWGTEPEAVKSLKTWLPKQRISVIDDVKSNQLASERGLHQPVSNPDVLKLAKTLGATQVVFVDADVYKSQKNEMLPFFGRPEIYKASLFVRAVNAETGEIDWSGKAQSTEEFTNLSEGIHQLTCHALATAWGLRSPGTATASSFCLPGQSVMVLAEPHTARYILAIAKAFRTVYAKQVVAQAARSNVNPERELDKG